MWIHSSWEARASGGLHMALKWLVAGFGVALGLGGEGGQPGVGRGLEGGGCRWAVPLLSFKTSCLESLQLERFGGRGARVFWAIAPA